MDGNDTVKLDQFIWYPIKKEKRGQDVYTKIPNVKSGGFNVLLYTDRFGGEQFSPIYYDTETGEPERFFIDDEDHREVIYSLVYPKPRKKGKEENQSQSYSRSHLSTARTAVLHSVIINKNLLLNGDISLFDVESAILDFIEEFPFPDEENKIIDELHVERDEENEYEYKKNLGRKVGPGAIIDLAKLIKIGESESNQESLNLNLVCNYSTREERKEIAIYLAQLLNFDCELYPLSFSTSYAKSKKHSDLFDLVVSEKEKRKRKKRTVPWTRKEPNPNIKEDKVPKGELETFYEKIESLYKM